MSSIPVSRGPWSEEDVAHFLRNATVPMRVAANTSDGFPVIVSLWFLYRDGILHAACSPESRLHALLRADPRCAVEIAVNEPPYMGVRGRAIAEIVDYAGGPVLKALLQRYLGEHDAAHSRLAARLLERADDEIALRIKPIGLASWDYSERMHDLQRAVTHRLLPAAE